MIQRFQGKHFALRCFKQLAHSFAAYTESAPVYAGDDLKALLTKEYLVVGVIGSLYLPHTHRSQQVYI